MWCLVLIHGLSPKKYSVLFIRVLSTALCLRLMFWCSPTVTPAWPEALVRLSLRYLTFWFSRSYFNNHSADDALSLSAAGYCGLAYTKDPDYRYCPFSNIKTRHAIFCQSYRACSIFKSLISPYTLCLDHFFELARLGNIARCKES